MASFSATIREYFFFMFSAFSASFVPDGNAFFRTVDAIYASLHIAAVGLYIVMALAHPAVL